MRSYRDKQKGVAEQGVTETWYPNKQQMKKDNLLHLLYYLMVKSGIRRVRPMGYQKRY